MGKPVKCCARSSPDGTTCPPGLSTPRASVAVPKSASMMAFVAAGPDSIGVLATALGARGTPLKLNQYQSRVWSEQDVRFTARVGGTVTPRGSDHLTLVTLGTIRGRVSVVHRLRLPYPRRRTPGWLDPHMRGLATRTFPARPDHKPNLVASGLSSRASSRVSAGSGAHRAVSMVAIRYGAPPVFGAAISNGRARCASCSPPRLTTARAKYRRGGSVSTGTTAETVWLFG